MNDSTNVRASRLHPVISASSTRTVLAVGILASLAFGSFATSASAQTTDSSSDAATAPADGTATADAPATATETPSTETATTASETPSDGASTALAAPTDAQAQQTDVAEAAQTQAPTDGTTVTASGQTISADEVAEERQAEREPLAWRNSYFNYSINSSFCSFSRDCQLTYNPVVYSFFSLAPRWYLDPATFFTFSQSAYVEHTDDDGATYAHEFQLFDTRIGLSHREAFGNFLILPGVNLWLPASKGSQAQQRYFRLGASLSGTWDPGVGGFNLSLQASYLHWFAGSNVALTHSPYDAQTAGPNGLSPSGSGNQASSVTGESDRITAGLTANWQPVEGFTITLQIFYFWINAWGLGNASVPVAGSDTTDLVLTDASSHWRAFDSYNLYFQYDFLPFLQGWIGFSNSTQLASVFNENGSVRSPVAIYDMQVALGVTITLDSVYEAVASAGEDDGLTPEQRQRRRQGLATRPTTGGSL